jgi:hypothetical protein
MYPCLAGADPIFNKGTAGWVVCSWAARQAAAHAYCVCALRDVGRYDLFLPPIFLHLPKQAFSVHTYVPRARTVPLDQIDDPSIRPCQYQPPRLAMDPTKWGARTMLIDLRFSVVLAA